MSKPCPRRGNGTSCSHQCRVVFLILVRIGQSELADGLVEDVRFTQIAADRLRPNPCDLKNSRIGCGKLFPDLEHIREFDFSDPRSKYLCSRAPKRLPVGRRRECQKKTPNRTRSDSPLRTWGANIAVSATAGCAQFSKIACRLSLSLPISLSSCIAPFCPTDPDGEQLPLGPRLSLARSTTKRVIQQRLISAALHRLLTRDRSKLIERQCTEPERIDSFSPKKPLRRCQ
jgi:hypothetical protein